MPIYTTPGVYFETVDASPPTIGAVRTDIAAFVGLAARGPLDQAVHLQTWEQFQAVFGGFIPTSYLAYSVKAFFENGGVTCFVVRVAAECVQTWSAAPNVQPADGSASVVASVDGFAPGAVVTVSQWLAIPSATGSGVCEMPAGIQRDHVLRAVDPGTRQLTWQTPLDAFDLSMPLLFATGSSPASATLLDATGAPTLAIAAASAGAWGNGLAVRLGLSSPASTRTGGATQPLDRSASVVARVGGFPVGALVRASQGQVPPAYHIVTAVDAARARLVWDRPLDVAFDLTQPISFDALAFSLTVSLDGTVREFFDDLSLIPTHPHYVGVAITPSSSQLIRVSDCQAAAPAPSPWPARLPDLAAANLIGGVLVLRGGRDGTAALQPIHLTGDPGAERKRGVRALEDVDEVALVAIPDALMQPRSATETAPLPPTPVNPCLPCQGPPASAPASPPSPCIQEAAPGFTPDQVYVIQQALVDHCEAMRHRIALLEPPVSSPVSRDTPEPVDAEAALSWRQRFDSSYAALYYPWLQVYDPLQLDGQLLRMVPPSGHVAGVIAHTDVTFGAFRAPANVALAWAQNVTSEIDPQLQGVFTPQGINCIRVFPGRGLRVYGARTLSSDPDWRYLNVRRLLLMIEKAVELSIQWAVFEPNNFQLRQMLSLAISSYLGALWSRGALAGAAPDEAFYVRCDDSNNPPDLGGLGQLVAEVGIAPSVPAEFVVFRVGRTENTLQTGD